MIGLGAKKKSSLSIKMNRAEKNSQPVRVYVRQKPFGNAEEKSKCINIVHKTTPCELTIKSDLIEKTYKFDKVFGGEVSQAEIYDTVIAPLLNYTISGYNCTAFAYGQTGTGKTYTIMGRDLADFNDAIDDPSLGMIPRAAAQLFTELAKLSPKTEYSLRISFIEIYNEEVRDLLQESTQLKVYDDPESKGSVYLKGLTEITTCNLNSVLQWLNIGLLECHTSATNLNARSSRSHTIFTFVVNTRETTSAGSELIKTGKLYLVDLAGSENTSRSGATSVRAREAGTINRSLLTLGKVIKALAQKVPHVPYRDSKLTRILQDSLGGSTKTCMIATFSPRMDDWDETNNTLGYALLARNVSNRPLINHVNKKHANIVSEFQLEIDKLKHELQVARSGTGLYVSSEHYQQVTEETNSNHQRILALIQEIRGLEDHKQSKAQEYEALMESFQETKSYLDQVKKELQEKTRMVKQKEIIVNYLQERDDQMTTTVGKLLQSCERTSTIENIYHEKLDKQRHAAVGNANIARDMGAYSLSTLQEIQDELVHQGSSTDTRISEVRGGMEFLNSNYMENLENISQLSKEVEGNTGSRILHPENLLTNLTSHHTYSTENKINLCNVIYNNLLQLNDPTEINESLEHLKQFTNSRTEDFKNKSATVCCKTIDTGIAKKENHLQSSKNLLEGVGQDYGETRNSIQRRMSIDNAFKNAVIEYAEKSDKEEAQTNNRLTQLLQKPEQLIGMIENHEDEQIGNKIKDSLSDYMQCQLERESQQMLMANAISDTVKEQEIESQNQITTSKFKLDNYFREVTSTIQENLNRHNREFKNVIVSWITKAKQFTNISTTAIRKTENINKNLELVFQELTQHKSDISGIVQRSSTKLEGLKNSTNSSTHVGDTPAKINVIYPRRLSDFVTPERLFNSLDEELPKEDNAGASSSCS